MTQITGDPRREAIELAMKAIEEQFGRSQFPATAVSKKKLGAVIRLDVSNYRSVKSGTVNFTDLTILVGSNGSGKSNLLDCLSFISDSLRFGCNFAISSRGGVQSLIRNTQRSGSFFSVKIHFILSNAERYSYKIKIKRSKYNEFEISEESLWKSSRKVFSVKDRKVDSKIDGAPIAVGHGNLLLKHFTSVDEFDKIIEFLSNIRLYSPNISALREMALPDTSSTLSKGAENIASIVDRASSIQKDKVSRYLTKINPMIRDFKKRKFGKMQAVNFVIRNNRYYMYPDNMSDGTLRAFALLVAIFQDEWENVPKTSLICIEEPETGLHPAAAAVMIDAISEASKQRQIVITTHSADILENIDADKTNIIFTTIGSDNSTKLSTISSETRKIIREGLYNPGELLKMGQLN